MHDKRFPGETSEYRKARDELLAAERDLKNRTEAVAALRRKLPLGGAIPEDYAFVEGGADPRDTTTREVKMSELFAPGKDTLVVYNFMYGSNMEKACPMCTCFLDALEGNAEHIAQRVNLVVVAKSPIARIREFAGSRGWRRLRLVSSEKNNFNRDYFGEDAAGRQNTMLHVFAKRGGVVRHFTSTELNMVPAEPGQNQRHIDTMWPLWNVLDQTPEGRGETWFPKLQY